jgi:hypothetical protein
MAEYVQPEVQEAKRLDEEEERLQNAAQKANETSDRYALLTVLFASVLFFGGISGALQSSNMVSAPFVMTIVLFLATILALGTMPICRE